MEMDWEPRIRKDPQYTKKFVPSDCEDCPCNHRLIQDWRETQQKFQSNARVVKGNWRLPGKMERVEQAK